MTKLAVSHNAVAAFPCVTTGQNCSHLFIAFLPELSSSVEFEWAIENQSREKNKSIFEVWEFVTYSKRLTISLRKQNNSHYVGYILAFYIFYFYRNLVTT